MGAHHTNATPEVALALAVGALGVEILAAAPAVLALVAALGAALAALAVALATLTMVLALPVCDVTSMHSPVVMALPANGVTSTLGS